MPVVGIFSQKGGQGKSTIIDILATSIQAKVNPLNNKNRVLVIDADYPQFSIFKLRALEVSFLKGDHETKDSFVQKYSKIYGENKAIFTVVKKDLLDVPDFIDKVQDNYDLVLVDIMGTVNTPGFNVLFLSKLDYIIVPTLIDYEDIESNMYFVKDVMMPLKMGRYSLEYEQDEKINKEQTNKKYLEGGYKKHSTLIDFSILFNRVENYDSDKEIIKQLTSQFKKSHINTFENFLFKRKKYGKVHVHHHTAGVKSTIFPANDIYVNKLIDEFVNYIKL